MEAVVDGLAAAAALAQDLAVFEPGDDVFDTGSDAAMLSVVLVADDAPGAVADGCGDGVDAAVAAVTEDDTRTADQVPDRCPRERDVVAVAGPAVPDRPRRGWASR